MDVPPQIVQQHWLAPLGGVPLEEIRGGLSGSRLWKCKLEHGFACLRGWPPAVTGRQRIEEIHAAMRQLSDAGLRFTPRLYCTTQGKTIASDGQQFWELTSWLEGSADYLQAPSPAKLQAAMRALAAVHDVWARQSYPAASPTVRDRVQRLEQWLGQFAAGGHPPLHASTAEEGRVALATWELCRAWGPSLLQSLQRLQPQPTRLQVVLRDIWSEHVLFTGDEVTGIVDFDAVRVDEPHTDVVRLLSSLEPWDRQRWKLGLQAYQDARTTGSFACDLPRLELLDRSATLLSALQWLQWLGIERRQFSRPYQQLLQRWKDFVSRAQQWQPLDSVP